MDEEEILAGILKRDPSALNEAMNLHLASVYSLCSAILAGLGTSEDIEECTNDTFYIVWKTAAKYDRHRAPFRTWILMVAKYTALERRRNLVGINHIKIPLNLDIIAAMTVDLSTSIEEREQIQAALKSLTAMERELIYKRYFLGASVADLAEEYGLSRQAVDNRLWRAKKSLKLALISSDEGRA